MSLFLLLLDLYAIRFSESIPPVVTLEGDAKYFDCVVNRDRNRDRVPNSNEDDVLCSRLRLIRHGYTRMILRTDM